MVENASTRLLIFLWFLVIFSSPSFTWSFPAYGSTSITVSSSSSSRPFSYPFKEPCSRKYQPHSTSTSIFMATIKFQGDSSSQLLFTTPIISSPPRSLPEFLQDEESNMILLGGSSTQSLSKSNQHNNNKNKELWNVQQPPIAWFGTELVSTFVNEMDLSFSETEQKIIISVLDAQTQIKSRGSTRVQMMEKIMAQSSFSGTTVYKWKQQKSSSSTSSYLLKAELSLTLTVQLPRFLPLPPGFNRIGSTIVNRTCKTRIRQTLQDLNVAYLDWASTNSDES